MKSEQYELLMSEIDIIAEKVKSFPEHMQEAVFNLLVANIVNSSEESLRSQEHTMGSEDALSTVSLEAVSGEVRNYVAEIENFYSRYRLSEASDMDISAFVAYFFTVLAPLENRVDAINEDHLIELCVITGRKLPGNCKTTLNNAKNYKRFLESRGKGYYALSKLGEHFVKHTLLKEED